MAKQRYINTKFWSDSFITELNPLDRYLFLYFLTNEHTNIAGIYELPLKVISFETGLELDMLKKMLKRLDGKVYYIDGWVFIKNFERHQAVNDSIIKGIEATKKEIPVEIMTKINRIRQAVDSLPPASPHDPTYSNTNTNTNTNIYSEPSSQPIPFNYHMQLLALEKRTNVDKLVAYYFRQKGFEFENEKQFAQEYGSASKYAKEILNSGYTAPQIDRAFKYTKEKYAEVDWKLSTIKKSLAEANKK